jgi:WhiB family redox-sensing transcriptional regulator
MFFRGHNPHEVIAVEWSGDAPLIKPEPWMAEGLCGQTDPEMFFPEKGGSTKNAKKVCQACPVRAECLDYALAGDQRFGIWGGLSERERRRLRTASKETPPPPRVARREWTPEEDSRLRYLAADPDRTNGTIARILGRPQASVRGRRRTLGIEPSVRRGRPKAAQQAAFRDDVAIDLAVAGERVDLTPAERREALRRLHAARLSDPQIAERLGLHVRTVLRLRSELGLPAAVGHDGKAVAS